MWARDVPDTPNRVSCLASLKHSSRTTVIMLLVKVPVLSEQMMVVHPRVSTLDSVRTMACCLAIFLWIRHKQVSPVRPLPAGLLQRYSPHNVMTRCWPHWVPCSKEGVTCGRGRASPGAQCQARRDNCRKSLWNCCTTTQMPRQSHCYIIAKHNEVEMWGWCPGEAPATASATAILK